MPVSSAHCDLWMLFKVIRKCVTVSLSNSINIVLSLYDMHDFLFTYIKYFLFQRMHFSSVNALDCHQLHFSSSVLQVVPISTSPLFAQD